MGLDPVTLGMIAVGMSAAGTVYTGMQQKEAAEANAEMMAREGAAEADAAVAQAAKIRKAARAQVGSANAAMAASGVAIGEGTALRINEQILEDSEMDAFSTMLTGSRRQRFANDQAGITRAQGSAALTGSLLSAGATMAAAGSRWKTPSTPASTAGGMGGGTGLKAPTTGFWGGQ